VNSIEKIVDRAFVINLAHRTERWAAVQAELGRIGYESYERFDAYGVNHLPPESYHKEITEFTMNGWYGNKFSHYGVIEAAKQSGYKAVMVFEDDVALHPEFVPIVEAALSQFQQRDWDWLQFGGNHRFFGGVNTVASPIDGMKYVYVNDGLKQETANLARILKMLTAHAYIVKDSAYDFILEHAIQSPLSIDGFYAYEVHPRFKCYSVIPCVATQTPGMNDIGNVYSDYRPYIGN
jgi:GR25 family glycosyltransferase involved in LPS biosynthesis